MVAIGSAFRNSAGAQIERYFTQVRKLSRDLRERGDSLYVISVEGDSTDNTIRELDAHLEDMHSVRISHNHGGPWFGSTEAPARFEALQGVGNAILNAVPITVEVFIYVESDLVWASEVILDLIDRVRINNCDVVAPMVFAGDLFYDIFAFRKDGQRFNPTPPFHPGIIPRELTEIDSAGSCLVMRGAVARMCRIPAEDGLVGFCRNVREANYKIWLDFDRMVRHP